MRVKSSLKQQHFNIQLAINESNSLNRINPGLVSEKEEFVYRSYLAMGQANIVLNEIKAKSNPSPGECLKLYINFLQLTSSITDIYSTESN